MRDRTHFDGRSSRIHAIVLTRDRSEVFRRCIHTALSTLGPSDALTILDDSCEATLLANAEVLVDAIHRSNAHISHLRAEDLHDVIARDSGGRRALWQSKTAPRDIAPLRNLSLLISSVVDASTTVLIDDDICDFDLDAMHRVVDTLDCGPEGLIAGAEIGGLSEQDNVTRLMDALRRLMSKADGVAVRPEELFRASGGSGRRSAEACGWVSAGYMAFRLAVARLYAFPPGYNEDWLWCLLHRASCDTRVVRTDHIVSHEPPSIRRPTREDILFELAGDIILNRFLTLGRSGCPDLWDDISGASGPDVMPAGRVQGVLDYAQSLAQAGYADEVRDLEPYGLSILRDMLRSGALEIDESAIGSAWSRDADEKARAFAATLRSANTHAAVAAVLREGRL